MRATVWSLTALAIGVRLVLAGWLHSPAEHIYTDMLAYHGSAVRLLVGLPSPWDTLWPVGYYGWLAGLYAMGFTPVHVGWIQAVLGGLCTPLTWSIARHLGARPWLAALAAAMVALHVPLVLYTGFLLTETLFSFGLTLGVWLLLSLLAQIRERPDAPVYDLCLTAGLAIGGACAVRANLMLAVPMFALVIALPSWRPDWQSLKRAIVFGVACALLPALAAARQSSVIGRRTNVSTNGGVNFFLNFAPVSSILYRGEYGIYVLRPIPKSFESGPVVMANTPLFEELYYYLRGVKAVREQPSLIVDRLDNFVELAGMGHQAYWPGWPPYQPWLVRHTRVFFVFGVVPACLGVGWLWRRRRDAPDRFRAGLLVCAPLMSLLVAGYFFLGSIRLRVPFDPLLCALAVLGLDGALRLWHARIHR